MELTVQELALAVGKGEGFIRQHIHRKHLSVHKRARNVTVDLDEAMRWAQQRRIPFVLPAHVSVTTRQMKEKRVGRLVVLSWHPHGNQARNLFTLLRHRCEASLGPWKCKPSAAWSSEDLGHEVRVSTMDALLEDCQQLVDHIVDSGVLEIDGLEIHYDLEPAPRRYWSYQDRRPSSEASVVSPFGKHSAQVVEYWSFAAGPRDHWAAVLKSRDANFRSGFATAGFPLRDRVDRVGNLMIAGAEDAIDFTLEAHRDHTLTFRVETKEQLNDGDYRATVWASHSGDDVLRREVPVTVGQTVIDLASDVDHVGYSVIRTDDGQCVDLFETHLIMAFNVSMRLDARPTLQIQDRGGQLIHRVKPSGFPTMINVRSDTDSATLDQGIRRLWIDRRIEDPANVLDRSFVRYGPAAFRQAVRHFIGLLSRDSDRKDPVYFADPYFMTYVKGLDGARLYLDMFAATAGVSLRVLCADKEDGRGAPWWTAYPKDLIQHVTVRSFLRSDGKTPAFHDRYLITPNQETMITHSFRGWLTDGVSFASHPDSLYRKETERLWSMEVGSSRNLLLVREIR